MIHESTQVSSEQFPAWEAKIKSGPMTQTVPALAGPSLMISKINYLIPTSTQLAPSHEQTMPFPLLWRSTSGDPRHTSVKSSTFPPTSEMFDNSSHRSFLHYWLSFSTYHLKQFNNSSITESPKFTIFSKHSIPLEYLVH